jgi:hypothetical protein
MTFLSFSWLFGLLVMLLRVLDSNFKLCVFYCQWTHQGGIEKSSGQFLGLIVMSHWLSEVWIRIQDVSFVLPLSLLSLENRVCLSRGVQVVGVAWQAVTKIMAGVEDLVQRAEDDHIVRVLGSRTIEMFGDAVCGLHHARGDEERGFLGWPSN